MTTVPDTDTSLRRPHDVTTTGGSDNRPKPALDDRREIDKFCRIFWLPERLVRPRQTRARIRSGSLMSSSSTSEGPFTDRIIGLIPTLGVVAIGLSLGLAIGRLGANDDTVVRAALPAAP